MPLLSEFSLEGRGVLVAGDGAGLAPAVSSALTQAGARVFVASPSSDALREALSAVADGARGQGIHGDLSDREFVAGAVARALDFLGGVDALVNLHVAPVGGAFLSQADGLWEEAFRLNLAPVALFSREVGRHMVRRGRGRIVNVVSGLAERGLWNATAFCAVQGAVLQFTRALALEWARTGVRVNALSVGWLPAWLRGLPPQEVERLARYAPVRRLQRPEDVAGAVVLLCADACDYTTGAVIRVDGGLSAHP